MANNKCFHELQFATTPWEPGQCIYFYLLLARLRFRTFHYPLCVVHLMCCPFKMLSFENLLGFACIKLSSNRVNIKFEIRSRKLHKSIFVGCTHSYSIIVTMIIYHIGPLTFWNTLKRNGPNIDPCGESVCRAYSPGAFTSAHLKEVGHTFKNI